VRGNSGIAVWRTGPPGSTARDAGKLGKRAVSGESGMLSTRLELPPRHGDERDKCVHPRTAAAGQSANAYEPIASWPLAVNPKKTIELPQSYA